MNLHEVQLDMNEIGTRAGINKEVQEVLQHSKDFIKSSYESGKAISGIAKYLTEKFQSRMAEVETYVPIKWDKNDPRIVEEVKDAEGNIIVKGKKGERIKMMKKPEITIIHIRKLLKDEFNIVIPVNPRKDKI